MNGTYKTPVIEKIGRTVGTGWLPPRPDLRDFTAAAPEIAEMTKKLGLRKGEKAKLSRPASICGRGVRRLKIS